MDKFIVGVILVSIVALIGGASLVSKGNTETTNVPASKNTEVVINETSHDWGEIGINDGNVEKLFKIKNEGSETLKLSNVVTSCMCTTAQLSLEDNASPVFGMHSKSSYIFEIPSGKTAELKVTFDPAFHGPSGVGPISRQITVKTNDVDKPELNFMLTAMVSK